MGGRLALSRVLPVGAVLLCLTSCKTDTASDSVGVAYVASISVNLRGELSQKANTVVVLKHGDKVQVVDVKRRFVQVRTANGSTGWIDAAQLLTPDQMKELQREHAEALTLPSEGTAGVFEALNIHLDPSRQSPSFARIPEGGSVEVLEHKLLPKATGTVKPPVFTIDRPQPERREKKKRETKQSFKLPPKPPPPKPPPNLDELSAAHVERPKAPQQVVQEPVKPMVLEDWTLVRTKDKVTGWVLTRNLVMSIPDEVAQYAEGKRITSYFSLGEVRDEASGVVKHNWLWTTLSQPSNADFDGWRVFLWNRRRHRFETSFRQHDVEGYFPVHVDGTDFSLITKDEDGKLRRRSYSFDGTRVHSTNTEEYRPEAGATVAGADKTGLKVVRPGWLARLWSKLRGKS
jgi:uncharacterized protein YgiM (DUF1202 family)